MLKNNYDFNFDKKIDIINEFEHNYILLVNGVYKSSDIKFEEDEKVKVQSLKSEDNLKNYSKTTFQI